MAELIESVKRHGIITPLTLSRDGDGRYAIIAGERRYRAAKAAKLREVPAQVREVDGEALTLAVAENVIRADLSPLEEARAYRRLVDEHGDAAKVAKLVGKSERLVARPPRPPAPARRDAGAARRAQGAARLRACPDRDRGARAAARRPDRRMARGAPARRGGLPRRRRARSWTTCSRPSGRRRRVSRFTRSPTASAATAARSSAPHADGTRSRRCWRSSARTREAVEAAYRRAARDPARRPSTTGRRREPEERRERDCFALTDDDADAARAFGCLLELPAADGRGDHRYVTDPEWLADRLVQKIARPRRGGGEADAARATGVAARSDRRRGRPGEAGAPRAARAATTKRGCPAARATSTSARRSRGGSRSSTRTP